MNNFAQQKINLKFNIMYLATLEIKNYKSFENVTLHFNPTINIFTGVNNCGKTTVLETIALWDECFSKLLRQAKGVVKGKYKIKDYTLGNTQPNYFTFQEIASIRNPNFEDIFRNLDSTRENSIKLSATLKNETDEITISFGIIAASGQVYNIIHDNYNDFDFTKFNDFFSKFPDAINLIYASPVANLRTDEEFERLPKIKLLTHSRSSMLVLRNRIFNLKKNETNFNKFLDDISFILNNNAHRIEIDTDSKEITDIKIQVTIKVDSKDTKKDISLVGSGTLQIIEIVLSLYEEIGDLNVVLLDEPDSYIHRDIQKRLLTVLEKYTKTAQIFITSHNETLIRNANPQYLFHLQKKSSAVYRNIMSNQINEKIHQGLQPSPYLNIINSLGSNNSLDFINALECDRLIFVEGESDAINIQILLNQRINNKKKYMYWAFKGVDKLLTSISSYKEVFSLLKNDKSLWDKSVLIFDKDNMTEKQRERLSEKFTNQFKIPTHIWKSYTFESTIFTDWAKFQKLIFQFIYTQNQSINYSDLENLIDIAVNETINRIRAEKVEDESKLKKSAEIINARRGHLESKTLKLDFKEVIEKEIDIQLILNNYYLSTLNKDNIHQLADKKDVEFLLNRIVAPYNILFSIETDFPKLLNEVNKSMWFDEWDFLLKL